MRFPEKGVRFGLQPLESSVPDRELTFVGIPPGQGS